MLRKKVKKRSTKIKVKVVTIKTTVTGDTLYKSPVSSEPIVIQSDSTYKKLSFWKNYLGKTKINMKKINIVTLVLLILFSSCYTTKKMERQVIKADITYPEEFLEVVNKLLPTKETTITKVDTIYLPGLTRIDSVFLKADCDTIKPDSLGKRIVYLPSVTKTRVDTFRINKIDSVITLDTRGTEIATDKLNKANIEIAKKSNTIKILGWTLTGIALLFIVIMVIKKFTKWLP